VDSGLDSARAKLDRAKYHLKMLAGAERRFWDESTGDYGRAVTTEPGPDGKPWAYMRLHEPPEPPRKLALIAGDAIHNTRAALDHLVFALVLTNPGHPEPPTRQNEFPIWEVAPSDGGGTRKTFDRKLHGIADEPRKWIVNLQPFSQPGTRESQHLLDLDGLDNIDKHRFIPPLLASSQPPPEAIDGVRAFVQGPNPVATGRRLRFERHIGPLQKGGWILRSPIPSDAWVDLQAPFMLSVRYGDPRISQDTLLEIREFVAGVVESFAPAFGG
jgi:hypothetical protein